MHAHRQTKTHCGTTARVEKEVSGVGSNLRLCVDWPVTQCHSNNGGHVGFSAKNMNGDTGGLSCTHTHTHKRHEHEIKSQSFNFMFTYKCAQTHQLPPSLLNLPGSSGRHDGRI